MSNGHGGVGECSAATVVVVLHFCRGMFRLLVIEVLVQRTSRVEVGAAREPNLWTGRARLLKRTPSV
jgi:hypothetical protein